MMVAERRLRKRRKQSPEWLTEVPFMPTVFRVARWFRRAFHTSGCTKKNNLASPHNSRVSSMKCESFQIVLGSEL